MANSNQASSESAFATIKRKACHDSVASLLNDLQLEPVVYRRHHGLLNKPKKPARNFMKDNMVYVKKLQETNKCKKRDSEKVKNPKVTMYNHVQPKVFTGLNTCNGPEILKSEFCERPKTSSSAPCPSIETEKIEVLNDNSDIDILNKPMRRPHSCTPDVSPVKSPHKLGHIPNYITMRKKAKEQEEIRLKEEAEKPKVPEGNTLVTPEEKSEIYNLLCERHKQLLEEYSKLPIVCDTAQRIRHKEQLEKELTKIEEGLEIFSREYVYIKSDS